MDVISQEALYNRINLNIANVNENDFYHLKSKIVEHHVTKNIISYIDRYRLNVTDKGGLFAAKDFISSLMRMEMDDEDGKRKTIYEDLRDYYPQFIQNLRDKAARGDADIISCGIREIDYAMVVGFAPGTLTLFCGDVGAYKSAMMMNVAVNIWKDQGKKVLIVPLEMPRDKWVQRMISRETKIPFDKIEHPNQLTKEEWDKLEGQDAIIKGNDQFYIMETAERIPVSFLRKEIEAHIDIFKPDVIVVDYIANLIPEAGSNNARNDLQIGEMLKDLRQMGKPKMGIHENGFAIISGAQIGREGLKRFRKTGAIKGSFHSEDLRGSQEYSADADNIFGQMKDPNNNGRLHLYDIKNRYGTGVFPNGSTKTSLEVQGNIGLIEGDNKDWITEVSQENILEKIDDPITDFDSSELDLPFEGYQ
ncbi:MAG: AAA family ATPase [Candidatus Scalindua sp.]|nr:AAA family ATPase [Candidatus Scalindua sp.]